MRQTGDLDANHRLAGVHDRADNAFDRLGQSHGKWHFCDAVKGLLASKP
jgi:hypothetical protein